uniref:Uncharacterized protein n=1 Tax=Ditylenchus dipsaci TaxID=166011 RepID=A0A915DN96_9BILA
MFQFNVLLPWDPKNFHKVPDYAKVQPTGPGEDDKSYFETRRAKKADEEIKHWFMNVVSSDKISLDRACLTNDQEMQSTNL